MVLNVIIRIVLIITNFTLTTLGYNLHRRNILFYVYVDCYWLCSLFNTSLFNFMYIWITRVVFNLYDIKLFWHNGFFLLIILNKKKWKGIIVWKYLLLINFFFSVCGTGIYFYHPLYYASFKSWQVSLKIWSPLSNKELKIKSSFT